MVRVLRRESRQQDAPGAAVAPVPRDHPGLRQRTQRGNDGRPVAHVGILAQEVVDRPVSPAAVAVVRASSGRHVSQMVVIRRVPRAAGLAAHLVGMVDWVDREPTPRVRLPQLLRASRAVSLVRLRHVTRDPRGGHEKPHELVTLVGVHVRRTALGADVVPEALAAFDGGEGPFGPFVGLDVPLRVPDALGRVVRRAVLRRHCCAQKQDSSEGSVAHRLLVPEVAAWSRGRATARRCRSVPPPDGERKVRPCAPRCMPRRYGLCSALCRAPVPASEVGRSSRPASQALGNPGRQG